MLTNAPFTVKINTCKIGIKELKTNIAEVMSENLILLIALYLGLWFSNCLFQSAIEITVSFPFLSVE